MISVQIHCYSSSQKSYVKKIEKMKSIRCFFNIHKYKNVDGRGIAADEDDHVCDFCWNKFSHIREVEITYSTQKMKEKKG